MVKALVALPTGTPQSILQGIFGSSEAIAPMLVIDGLGAVVEIPSNMIQAIAAIPGIAAVSSGMIPTDIDVHPTLRPWLEGWNKLVSPQYRSMLGARPAGWATQSLGRVAMPFAAPPVPTLTGTIAMGIINVAGPSNAHLTQTDYVDIVLGVIHGLEHLYRNAPATAKLVFVAEQRFVTLGVDPATIPGPLPNATFQQSEDRERLWRDPALQKLGFSAGFAGVDAYRTKLLNRPWATGNAQKAIVGFVTRFGTAQSAYAALGRWVVNLPQTDVFPGRSHIDRVIAHEISHLFGAQDEYAGCKTFVASGPFHVINGNCVDNPLSTIGRYPCLMAGTSDDMCPWTKAHVGWTPFP